MHIWFTSYDKFISWVALGMVHDPRGTGWPPKNICYLAGTERLLTGLHKLGGAHQTFLNTQFTWESLVMVVGRGEVGIAGYQPNIDAC